MQPFELDVADQWDLTQEEQREYEEQQAQLQRDFWEWTRDSQHPESTYGLEG